MTRHLSKLNDWERMPSQRVERKESAGKGVPKRNKSAPEGLKNGSQYPKGAPLTFLPGNTRSSGAGTISADHQPPSLERLGGEFAVADAAEEGGIRTPPLFGKHWPIYE